MSPLIHQLDVCIQVHFCTLKYFHHANVQHMDQFCVLPC